FPVSAPVPAPAAAFGACSGMPSDFDGDGRADLAVAAPYTEVGGHARAGSVTVLYGMRTGRRLTQDDPGVPGEAENGDAFGSALAVGDFDGDAARTWPSACRRRTGRDRVPTAGAPCSSSTAHPADCVPAGCSTPGTWDADAGPTGSARRWPPGTWTGTATTSW
ncbi:FG-GAP repeat protein, partial [Planomonospora algeriensis]